MSRSSRVNFKELPFWNYEELVTLFQQANVEPIDYIVATPKLDDIKSDEENNLIDDTKTPLIENENNLTLTTKTENSSTNSNLDGESSETEIYTDEDNNLIAENMAFDPDFALKMIPEYGGKSSELHKFLTLCDDIYSTLDLDGVTDKDKIKKAEKPFLFVVKRKLIESAYDDIVKFKSYASWNEMKAALKQSFSEARPSAHIQNELIHITQAYNEDVRTYASRVQKLLSQLNDSCIESEGENSKEYFQKFNEKTALKAFEDGLKDTVKLIVKASRHKTLKDAISHACEEEISIPKKALNPSSDRSVPVRCQICKRTGHTSLVCFQRFTPNNNIRSNSSPPSNFPNQSRVQHFNVVCAYCKRQGHHINDCRKRQWYNNNKSTFSQKTSPPENSSGLNQKLVKPQTTSVDKAAVRAQDLN